MMKWLMVLVAMFSLVSPGLAVAGTGSWGSVSNQVASSWDQVQEVGQKASARWGGQVISAGNPATRCRRICRRECETMIEEVCNDFGTSCKTFARVVCNFFCETLCDELYP